MVNIVSGYRLEAEIYESLNSQVFRAYQEADNRPVILKMMKQAYPSPEKIAWFRREYELTRDLNLTGVVNVYDLKMNQIRPFMVLEDFGGESLDRFINHQRLSLTEFLSLAIQIVNHLEQVHRRRVIHKDINPSNIVLNWSAQQVKLIDFGISTILSRETPTVRSPNVLEGTLAYISPEQTGRMNRTIDYRTDFYSLGATFYELLTGRLPFPAGDPLEVVHAHLARDPLPPHLLKPDLPPVVSEIILKLMAKNAEDRYQSAPGLKADLAECLRQLETTGRIEAFPLGRTDRPDQFQIPQKLYGRQAEIANLLAAFEGIVSGGQALMLVSGYAGIGKSALVQEVYRPITRHQGYFISGKFDQLQRNVPYHSVVQAFRSLLQQLLTETEARLTVWRDNLTTALGPNGRAISEVIPEVELIIGPQPAIPTLPPAEAQNRFNLVFQNFIQVFAGPDHPLVIFLDDLQWADAASLNLIRLLMTTPDSHHLFIIGAYRDNEVGPTHALRLTIDQIRSVGSPVSELTLRPLHLAEVNRFVADALRCPPQAVRPLAELLMSKTNGNPFFLNEMLKSLHADGLLTPIVGRLATDQANGAVADWQWDLGQIRARSIADNVVELMQERLNRLGPDARQVVKLAACIGNRFSLPTLATVHARSVQVTADHLWPALTEGLILPLNDAYKLMDLDVAGLDEAVIVEYKFTHDRIQQAAYALIPEADRAGVHRQVGRLLLQKAPLDQQPQQIFDIVNQLNLGRAEIEDPAELAQLAELNLQAARRAKTSAAYNAMFDYAQAGLALLSAGHWRTNYALTLALHIEGAEAAYLNTNFEAMEDLAEVVLRQARSLLDAVQVHEIKIMGYKAQNRFAESVEIALTVLSDLGETFPAKPHGWSLRLSRWQTGLALIGKSVEALADLPAMTDPNKLATMRLFSTILSTVYIIAPNLLQLFVRRMVVLSIRYGNAPALSANGYANYGLVLCAAGEVELGYRFGQLALRLAEAPDAKTHRGRIIHIVNTFIRPWHEHPRQTLKSLLTAYQATLETGDFDFAAQAPYIYLLHSYHISREITELEREMVEYGEVLARLKQSHFANVTRLYRQVLLNLLGRAEDPTCLQGEAYDEEAMRPTYLASNNRSALAALSSQKMILCYLFGAYEAAVEHGFALRQYQSSALGSWGVTIIDGYFTLALLATLPDQSGATRRRYEHEIKAGRKRMSVWARQSPINHLHKVYLIEAECARLAGQERRTRDYYDQAISLAQKNGFLKEEAVACELAGRYYLGRGQSHLARYYLRDAHYAYQRWGAVAKVTDLIHRYPQFLTPEAPSPLTAMPTSTTTTRSHPTGMLDLTSVLKASQAISGEIVLDRLLERLMAIVIENAGARHGCLILEEQGEWFIEAEGRVASEGAAAETVERLSTPVEDSDRLSPAIVYYVARTRQSIVLNDAAQAELFGHDPYLQHHQVKSVLCMPLLNRGRLTGIIYLENNLTTAAFTPDRLELLNLLSSQAAVSIENARLYSRQVALTNAYSRFVPRDFLRLLNKRSIVEVRLSDQIQQEAAILFSDIRDFTTLSETMTPQENFDFVNDYLGRVSPVIREYRGFIVKYLGDGMMAVFPDRVEDALDAAIAKLAEVGRYNDQRRARGEQSIRVGIGIHTGKMMLGTVGEAERLQGDLLSDAVNLASRLEGLTKRYGVSLIVSAEVLIRLDDPSRYRVRFLGRTQVKGRQEAVSVFELLDGEPQPLADLKWQTKSEFEQALIAYYDRRFAEAHLGFEAVLNQNPVDVAAHLYLSRTRQLLDSDVPADWTGVEVLQEK